MEYNVKILFKAYCGANYIKRGVITRKLLLTSTGFNNKKIEEKFLELVEVPKEKIKSLFIPTAAISEDARAMVKECKKDLLNAGILEKHIITYNLDREYTYEEICNFNAIYFCGGNPGYLLNRVNESKFKLALNQFLDNGGVYIGVSAGSVIAASNLENNLGYINCYLDVHKSIGTDCGNLKTNNCPNVSLTDNQAILILGENVSIIE
ncbi:Type 1 glutamine amidotransferase-like domain-containing protein [Clostridium tagluense]|uniref:Type 1 glutamine amidotransferase-like domain-containing protein n=1 Tax=Clostridium tagluense TaxID=360422 RepID=UPI001CF55F15|nr:Type 1 glutamine amidotransferase-like domain-containing protein [Clostridium tagluense]MCB2299352.1 Type 1 glutamine amidotransferase-like domain-containing protein [Clostridium tagluense]